MSCLSQKELAALPFDNRTLNGVPEGVRVASYGVGTPLRVVCHETFKSEKQPNSGLRQTDSVSANIPSKQR